MNINNFDGQINLNWYEMQGEIGKVRINFLLPIEVAPRLDKIDWSGSEIRSLGWVSDRVSYNNTDWRVWWGSIQRKNESEIYPLILEYYCISTVLAGSRSYFLVKTPPGRPGNPMTILIDRDGEVVPDIHFPAGSNIKIFPLNKNWGEFGWKLVYPAIGLQFVEGVCLHRRYVISGWQAQMLRQKS